MNYGFNNSSKSQLALRPQFVLHLICKGSLHLRNRQKVTLLTYMMRANIFYIDFVQCLMAVTQPCEPSMSPDKHLFVNVGGWPLETI